MSDRLPLLGLQVFCAVVRHGGFRQAALALHVTPGAVSRQVQALEAQLGQQLFERGPGPAQPTAAGRRLMARVQAPLEAIAAALQPPQAAARRAIIRVDCGVTLAMHWLIPQLQQFHAQHPRWQVVVHTVDGDIDMASPADVFIRREASELRGLPADTFLQERAVLVAAAAMPASAARRAARIGASTRPDLWPTWADAMARPHAALAPTLEFDNTVLAIQAVLQGLGVGVLPEPFVAPMLAAGSLRPLHALRPVSGSYAVAVGRRRDSTRTRAFVAWLKALAPAAAPPPARPAGPARPPGSSSARTAR